jgi:hypothetical protein
MKRREMAGEVPKNQLTGNGNGFLAILDDIETLAPFSVTPSEVQNNSLMSFIIKSYYDPIPADGIMAQFQAADISDGHQDEVLELLDLGLGAVDSNEKIWLVYPIIKYAYVGGSGDLRILLIAMVSGRLAALKAERPINDTIHLTRQVDAEIAELDGLLAKLKAVKIEE